MSVKIHCREVVSTLLSTLALAACSAPQETQPTVGQAPSIEQKPAASTAVANSAAPASASVAMSEAPPPQTAEKVADVVPPGPPAEGHELLRFHASLRALEGHTRKEHVRILWLGDSHGQADFWSGALRDSLTKRFGYGGPGFLHLGYKAYRHDGVTLKLDGVFGVRPPAPATAKKTGDGVWGLGGLMAHSRSPGAGVNLDVSDKGLPATLSMELCFRAKNPEDSVLVKVGEREEVVSAKGANAFGITRAKLTIDTKARVVVRPSSHDVELCGAILEADPAASPGVVVDTLGINGARYVTALAWDETAWIADVERRGPDLVVLEYGTNEAGDKNTDPMRYADHVERLMERVRRAAPSTDCVVLSLTDRVDTAARNAAVRDAQREGARRARCAFWDTYEVMGGFGSFVRWRGGTQPLASPDGVHLTTRGYRELGKRLADDLLKGYDAP